MPSYLRRTVAALIFALLASWAWAPAFDAPLARGEFRTLLETRELAQARSGVFARRAFELHGADGHWLTALDLLRVHEIWSSDGQWSDVSSRPLRIENAVLLALAAVFLARFARRAFSPWTGSDPARAAGWAAAALFALHPVQGAVLASLEARGDLLALVFAAGAAWLFLHGRQKQVPRALIGALACTVAAGACSDGAWALPVWLAIAEFASGKRQRPLEARVRTASTTLLVFGAAVALDTLVRSAVLGRWSPPTLLAFGNVAQSGLFAVERIGTLLVPVDATALGPFGFTLAGAAALVALQPALTAARSAPRLWGWMLLAWACALAAGEAASSAARVNTRDFTQAATLITTASVASVGLGVAVTAVSGLRRALLPLVIGLAYAILCHANAIAFRDAANEGAAFRGELARARAESAAGTTLFALDPPRAHGGLAVLDGALPAMLDAMFTGAEGARANVDVRCAPTSAFLAFAREPEFATLRESGVAVLAPRSAFTGASADTKRELVLLSKFQESSAPHGWSGEGRSRTLDVDTPTTQALHVRASEESQAQQAPIAAWRADAAPLEFLREGRLVGAWTYGGDAPEALFDLSSSLAWLCAGRVTQMWSAEGWNRIDRAELLGEAPRPEVELSPRADGDDWVFEAPGDAIVFGADVQGEWTLGLLAVERLEQVELAVQRDGSARVRAVGAGARAAELASDGAVIAWSLERRISGVAVERARGRWTR